MSVLVCSSVCVCKCLFLYVCVCATLRVQVSVLVCVCVCVCICLCVCECLRAQVYSRVCECVHRLDLAHKNGEEGVIKWMR